jgi:hypothetical protein
MVIDLHVVVPGGGDSASLDRLLDASIEAGLDGICLLGPGTPPPVEAARGGRFAGRISLYFGIEFPLERGRLLWIPENPDSLAGGEWRTVAGDQPTGASVMAVRERCGGVIVAAHPYERLAGPALLDAVYGLRGIDGVIAATAPLDRVRNKMAIEAAQRMNLAVLGGSGSAAGPAEVGVAATLFPVKLSDQASLVAAIRRKDAWTIEMLSRPDQMEPEEETSGERDRESGRGSGRSGRGPRGAYGPGDRHRGPPENAHQRQTIETDANRRTAPADERSAEQGAHRRRRRRGGGPHGSGESGGGDNRPGPDGGAA